VNALPDANGVLYIGIGLNVSDATSAPRASTVDDSPAYLATTYQANLPLGGNILYALELTDGTERRHL
jgi:hypothetical protein